MSKETTQRGKLGDLQRLLSSMNANATELAHLEASRVRFADMLGKAQEAADRESVHTAAKQEASLDFRTALTECQRLANILRLGVKQHFGIRSEKLAEFDLQPFRGRKPQDAEEPEPSAPSPPEPQAPSPVNPKQS